MYEVPAIIGACTTCIAPASLITTFAMILVGTILAVQSERRISASDKIRSEPGRS